MKISLKKFLLLSLLTISSSVYAEISDLLNEDFCKNKKLIINGFSTHFSKSSYYATKYGYNEKNYGLGFNCGLEKLEGLDTEIEIGIARNSYRSTAIYASYGLAYQLNDNFSFGAKMVVSSGYYYLKQNHGYQAGPMLYSRLYLTDKIGLNLSVLPVNKGFMLLSLVYKF